MPSHNNPVQIVRRPGRARWVYCACVVAGLWSFALENPAIADSRVVLRGGAAARDSERMGQVLSISSEGVEVVDLGQPASPEGEDRREPDGQDVATAGRRAIMVSWDRVARVEGRLAGEAAPFMDGASLAWRARARMERGDMAGAEPLLEQLFVQQRGQRGPTAALVASGLLRCRLQRQAQSAAVEAWLALMASEHAEVLFAPARLDEDVRPTPMIDQAWGLCPQLPPIWIKGPALGMVVGAIAQDDGPPATRAARLSQWYRASAAFESGEAVVIAERPVGDAGLQLAWDVIASRVGSPTQREAAIAGLAQRLAPRSSEDEPLPAWVEAWTRVALGRAMIASAGDGASDARNLGIVHLLHVPARLDGASQYLAGLALVEASVALVAGGDAVGAASVRRLFAERFSGHPAQSMLLLVQPDALSGRSREGGTSDAAPSPR